MSPQALKLIADSEYASSTFYYRDGKTMLEVWKRGDKYRLKPYSSRFAQRLQKLLKYFPEGTKFVHGEEPVFSIPLDQLRVALTTLGLKK